VDFLHRFRPKPTSALFDRKPAIGWQRPVVSFGTNVRSSLTLTHLETNNHL
jgi:hypothetical protein